LQVWSRPVARGGTSATTSTPRRSNRSSSGGSPRPGKALTVASVPAGGSPMRINLTSVMVDDQDKALRFYTEVLGFERKHDIPMGEHRWITVVSPEDPDGTQLVLEPDAHPAAKAFKQALFADGIPLTSFAVDDARAEHERLRGLGVRFHQEPTAMGPVTVATFDDTCGNLIQMVEI